MIVGIITGVIVAAIVAVFGWIWKAPRRWIVEFVKAGFNKPGSELHAVVTGRFTPIWSRVDTPDGPWVAWQCELRVTNAGNRVDIPVRGELVWQGRRTTFTTALSDGQRQLPILDSNWSGLLKLNAWTSLRAGENPGGELLTEIILHDQYGGHQPSQVTFSPVTPPVVPPDQCGATTVRDGKTLLCDQRDGHGGGHSHQNVNMRIVTTWDESGAGPDFVVS